MVNEWVVKDYEALPIVEKDRYSTTYIQWKSKKRTSPGDSISQYFQAFKDKGKEIMLKE